MISEAVPYIGHWVLFILVFSTINIFVMWLELNFVEIVLFLNKTKLNDLIWTLKKGLFPSCFIRKVFTKRNDQNFPSV